MSQASFLKCKLTTLYLQRLFGVECSIKCHCNMKEKGERGQDKKIPGKAEENVMWIEWSTVEKANTSKCWP